MTSYDDWYPSNYFKADDVIDDPLILTITAIRPEKMQDGKSKPCVFFKEDKRGAGAERHQQEFSDPADAQQGSGRCCRPARHAGGGRGRVSGQAVHGPAAAPAAGRSVRQPRSQPKPATKPTKRKPPKPDDDMGGEAA